MRRQSGDLLAFEADRALRLDHAHHRLDHRRTAYAVAPEQADDLALMDVEGTPWRMWLLP